MSVELRMPMASETPVCKGTDRSIVENMRWLPCETAKLCLVNPKSYLHEATHAALTNPGTALLPHRLLS